MAIYVGSIPCCRFIVLPLWHLLLKERADKTEAKVTRIVAKNKGFQCLAPFLRERPLGAGSGATGGFCEICSQEMERGRGESCHPDQLGCIPTDSSGSDRRHKRKRGDTSHSFANFQKIWEKFYEICKRGGRGDRWIRCLQEPALPLINQNLSRRQQLAPKIERSW